MEKRAVVRSLRNGANQKGVRNHNERLILSVLQRNDQMSGSQIARRTGLSAQTISVIMRKLEGDGLVLKGDPVKGRVGKPSIPMRLNPQGALSFGCKIGRRSCEFFLTDLFGEVLFKRHLPYDIALPQIVFEFLSHCHADAIGTLDAPLKERLCGIGIAVPFDMWKWDVSEGSSPGDFLLWKDVSFAQEIAKFSDLPLFVVNDGTSACWAEQVYGCGRELQNYAYFFVSTFIGGGVVLNQSVYEGTRGNAAAFGPLRVGDRNGRTKQLLDVASLYLLEGMLTKEGYDPRHLWKQPQDWSAFASQVEFWIEESAQAIAQACVSVCAVIDFEAVVLDGYFPDAVKTKLTERVRHYMPQEDSRGLILPEIRAGKVGFEARAVGAASIPIFRQYFLGNNAMVAK